MLHTTSLKESQEAYKKFRARRRLKSSVQAVISIGKLRRLTAGSKMQLQVQQAVEETSTSESEADAGSSSKEVLTVTDSSNNATSSIVSN